MLEKHSRGLLLCDFTTIFKLRRILFRRNWCYFFSVYIYFVVFNHFISMNHLLIHKYNCCFSESVMRLMATTTSVAINYLDLFL